MSECIIPSSREQQSPTPTASAATAMSTAAAVMRPRYTVRALEGAYEVGIFMPGVKRDAVTVRLEDDLLQVNGTREEFNADGWRLLRRELGPVHYRLELEITVPVDATRISARLEDGVLSLRLPLREEAKGHDIPIA